MNVNATLLIQMFNFCAVYWMLRLFLFRPIIALIHREDAQEAALFETIAQQKNSIEIQEAERHRYWSHCRNYFITHQPPLFHERRSFSDETSCETQLTHTLSDEDIARIAHQLSGALEEKIKHVH
jgi:hypothetical protein